MPEKLTIALAGNPNSGKTTVFNALTGSRQHVGNYPGVTVEKKEGGLKYKDYEINVVDLPGTYSLTAYSIDEIITRNFIVEEKPDVVIDIIDTSNLERNLYLATQLMELNVPLVLAFNMADVAKRRGLEIDRKVLSELLGCPIVFTVATKQSGIDALLEEALKLIKTGITPEKVAVGYGREIQEEAEKIENIFKQDKELTERYPLQWLALKLLEDDSEVTKRINRSPYAAQVLEQTEKSITHLKNIFGDSPEAIIAERRYGFISGACSEAVKQTYEVRHTISDRIDKVLVNRILGLPIFLGLAWLLFKFTFQVSEPLMGWVEAGQEWLGSLAGGVLPEASAVQSLIVDGVIGGVGSV
ncbi:MAG: ferrous iron transporter B, partial [Candidatus Omnitrophota bacterium]|nr:ferrous iron transporter B [Candidatus Omnitrophota bacterium]